MVILLFMLGDQDNKITMLWTFEFWIVASKAKVEWKEVPESNEEKNEIKEGWIPSPSITNVTG